MEYMPLVSVIVPVYKTEKYISECVSSILDQTYPNMELILVDDQSPDQCPQICDQYAATDSRVRVIHKKNEGAICAREAGLQFAQGVYCMFVDGDDWIDPDTLSQCVGVAQRDKCDCVMFSYIREYPVNSIENPLFDADFSYNLLESEQLVHRRLIGPVGKELSTPQRVDNFSSMCMKLYRMDVAQKGRIVSDRIVGTSEDTIFNIYALEGCRISYLNRCMYHYRKDNIQSITTHYKADLVEKWDVLYQIFQEYIGASSQMEKYHSAFLNRVACCTIGLGLNEIGNHAGIVQIVRRIRAILSKSLYQEAFTQLDTTHCPVQWKLFFWLCRHRAAWPLTVLLQIVESLRSRMAA